MFAHCVPFPAPGPPNTNTTCRPRQGGRRGATASQSMPTSAAPETQGLGQAALAAQSRLLRSSGAQPRGAQAEGARDRAHQCAAAPPRRAESRRAGSPTAGTGADCARRGVVKLPIAYHAAHLRLRRHASFPHAPADVSGPVFVEGLNKGLRTANSLSPAEFVGRKGG